MIINISVLEMLRTRTGTIAPKRIKKGAPPQAKKNNYNRDATLVKKPNQLQICSPSTLKASTGTHCRYLGFRSFHPREVTRGRWPTATGGSTTHWEALVSRLQRFCLSRYFWCWFGCNLSRSPNYFEDLRPVS